LQQWLVHQLEKVLLAETHQHPIGEHAHRGVALDIGNQRLLAECVGDTELGKLQAGAARDMARRRLLEVVGTAQAAESRELRLVIREWYARRVQLDAWRPRYRQKVDALIRHYVEAEDSPLVKLAASTRKAIQELGSKPVAAVTRSDVMRVADGLKPGAAEQFMAIGSAFYNDAFDRGVEVVNPFRNRLRVTGGRRVRHRTLSDGEILTLWRALEGEGEPALTCFLLLVYTGCRRREATGMLWQEIDLEQGTGRSRRSGGKRAGRTRGPSSSLCIRMS